VWVCGARRALSVAVAVVHASAFYTPFSHTLQKLGNMNSAGAPKVQRKCAVWGAKKKSSLKSGCFSN
jgi:hypothetical protein